MIVTRALARVTIILPSELYAEYSSTCAAACALRDVPSVPSWFHDAYDLPAGSSAAAVPFVY